jgi:transposase
MRDRERLLGPKTMEAEILREALDLARAKKLTLLLPSWSAAGDGSR